MWEPPLPSLLQCSPGATGEARAKDTEVDAKGGILGGLDVDDVESLDERRGDGHEDEADEGQD